MTALDAKPNKAKRQPAGRANLMDVEQQQRPTSTGGLRAWICPDPALPVEGHNRLPEVENPSAVEHALRERVKELNCLYGISGVIDRCGRSIEKLLCGIVELLPDSWQYPEVACARMTFQGQEYKSTHFQPSRWRQAADIRAGGKEAGVVEVYYLRKRPTHDEGPFLREERLLIRAVAERVGRAIDRIRAEGFIY